MSIIQELPLYKQLADFIKRDIIQGKWGHDNILPSEKDIAEMYSVSQGTVKKSMQELVNEGLLERRRGHGTYISKLSQEESFFQYWNLYKNDDESFNPAQEMTTKLVKITTDVPQNSGELKLVKNAKTQLIHIHRLRFDSQKPLVYEQIILPKKIFKGIDKLEIPHAFYPFLQQKFNLSVKQTEDSISVGTPNPEIAQFLGCDKNKKLLKVERYAKNLHDEIFEYRVSYVDPDIMHYKSKN